MRKLAVGTIAVCALIGATALPALAEVDVYAGPRGVGVDVGTRHRERPHGYYNYAPGWREHHRDWHGHRHESR
jgi:hypothetical protein